MVYIENENKLNRHKLDEIRIGPYPITKKISNTVYEINEGRKLNSKCHYHASKILKVILDCDSTQTSFSG